MYESLYDLILKEITFVHLLLNLNSVLAKKVMQITNCFHFGSALLRCKKKSHVNNKGIDWEILNLQVISIDELLYNWGKMLKLLFTPFFSICYSLTKSSFSQF